MTAPMAAHHEVRQPSLLSFQGRSMLGTQRWDLVEGDEVAPGRRIIEPLGRGERYQTYLATDAHLLTTVVVKVLRADRRNDARARRGLLAEARMLERIHHPVIVRAFGAVVDGQQPHIVLEHLEGPALSTLLRRHGPLPLRQLLPLAIQIGAALHYLHAERVVHLDIKPRNIIMGAPPRLIDLSVARSFAAAEALEDRVGTDAYMAPEQVDPAAHGPVGPGADVWGLGVTLYEALAGRRPWPGAADGAAHPQVRGGPAPLPRDVPRDLADIVLACLRPDAAARPAPVEVLDAVEPLVAALPTRPVLSRLRPRFRPSGE
jgi:serine/threonine protein kinase